MPSAVLPASVLRVIDEFSRLPGIGPKTASRLAFFLLRAPDDQAAALSQALGALKASTQLCSRCQNITELDPCQLCSDDSRDQRLLCVVQEPLDVVAIERSRAFHGLYHVLHGVISPVEGIGPEDLKIAELVLRIEGADFGEIIVATDATLEGDATALYLQRRLAAYGIRLSRPARGLPVGGDLEYTDEITLGRAMEGRQQLG